MIPDFTDATCRQIPGFTELPTRHQLQACRDCPLVRDCLRYAIDVIHACRPSDRNEAFRGMVMGGVDLTTPARLVVVAGQLARLARSAA